MGRLHEHYRDSAEQEGGERRVKVKIKLRGEGESRGAVLEWDSCAVLGRHWKQVLRNAKSLYRQLSDVSSDRNTTSHTHHTASPAQKIRRRSDGSQIQDEVGRTWPSTESLDAPKADASKAKTPPFGDGGKGRSALAQKRARLVMFSYSCSNTAKSVLRVGAKLGHEISCSTAC